MEKKEEFEVEKRGHGLREREAESELIPIVMLI